MKQLANLLIVMAFSSLTIFAQEQTSNDEIKTLFGKTGQQTIGGFGALSFNYGKVNNLDAIFMGARGAVVLNHNLAIGLGGKGFITAPVLDANLGEDYEYAGGYGGFYLEPIVWGKQPIHLSFPILIGAGGLGYVKHWGDYNNTNNQDFQKYDEDSYAFFVFEPGVELEFNIVRFMRIALTANYRLTSDIKLNYKNTDLNPTYAGTPIAPNDLLRGFSVGVIMKFGKF